MDHEVLAEALLDPSIYPHPVEAVERLQTHISSVFLTGQRVYKLKKPVDFGFLDFTTLEKRAHFCREELRLNSRLAPSVYLGVEPITRSGGRLQIGGQGEVVDWLVVMRQMDSRLMGLEVLKRGELGQEQIEALVEELVPFYRQAATGQGVDEFGGLETIRFNTDENFAQTADHVGVCLSEDRYGEIKDYTNNFMAERADLFERRIAEGRIRECHGDLHLANICFEEPPIIYDCIEFNQRFRCSDVAADVAFLAMDLDFHGLQDLSAHLVGTYIERSGDQELGELIDFYKCYRAYVRGKIHAFTFDDQNVRGQNKAANLALARRYFALAHAYAQGRSRPMLFVVYGLMGTGKSSLARWMWGQFGWPLLRSDVVRKKLAGLAETTKVPEKFNQGLYSPEMSARTYEEMFARAEGFLQAGVSVVLDASFKAQDERDQAADLAGKTGAGLLFVQTACEPDEQRGRLERRWEKGEVSDGRVELMDDQAEVFAPPGAAEQGRHVVIATDGAKEQTRGQLLAALKERGLTE